LIRANHTSAIGPCHVVELQDGGDGLGKGRTSVVSHVQDKPRASQSASQLSGELGETGMGGSRLLRGGFACFGCPALNFGRKDAWISI